ncbi:MAG: hypothetical protein LBK06_10315 [Planctomycetaceae bacterium]|nr:hypothetical protein [Planctomycetaceae bacterium]
MQQRGTIVQGRSLLPYRLRYNLCPLVFIRGQKIICVLLLSQLDVQMSVDTMLFPLSFDFFESGTES